MDSRRTRMPTGHRVNLKDESITGPAACAERGRHLSERGRYVIEGSHPAGYFSPDKRVLSEWEQERDGRAMNSTPPRAWRGWWWPPGSGDFDDLPLTDERAWRMITVLRSM